MFFKLKPCPVFSCSMSIIAHILFNHSWRISRWGKICPVALKMGRSLSGKPEFAVSFMDKVFFLSSKQAADQFMLSPRPYLLPKMPSSPIKFVVIGHPLAGKTTFAKQLASMTDSTVSN